MLVSPFTFYRGAASVMAHDLASTPRSGLQVQLCGDAHLANFGFFASPERSVVFDLNDFDETQRGPFEWDVKRLAASFEVAGRDRGFTDAERRTAVLEVVKAYREAMREFAAMRNLDLWYARIDAREFEAFSRIGSHPRLRRYLLAFSLHRIVIPRRLRRRGISIRRDTFLRPKIPHVASAPFGMTADAQAHFPCE